jgi:hypothetical protein
VRCREERDPEAAPDIFEGMTKFFEDGIEKGIFENVADRKAKPTPGVIDL